MSPDLAICSQISYFWSCQMTKIPCWRLGDFLAIFETWFGFFFICSQKFTFFGGILGEFLAIFASKHQKIASFTKFYNSCEWKAKKKKSSLQKWGEIGTFIINFHCWRLLAIFQHRFGYFRSKKSGNTALRPIMNKLLSSRRVGKA